MDFFDMLNSDSETEETTTASFFAKYQDIGKENLEEEHVVDYSLFSFLEDSKEVEAPIDSKKETQSISNKGLRATQAANREIRDLKAQLQVQRSQLAEKTELVEKQKRTLEKMRKENGTLKYDLEKIKVKNKALGQEVESLKHGTTIQQKDEEIAFLQQTIRELKKKNGGQAQTVLTSGDCPRCANINSIRTSLNERERDFRKRIEAFETRCRELERDSQLLASEREEARMLRLKVERLEQDLQETKRKFEMEKDALMQDQVTNKTKNRHAVTNQKKRNSALGSRERIFEKERREVRQMKAALQKKEESLAQVEIALDIQAGCLEARRILQAAKEEQYRQEIKQLLSRLPNGTNLFDATCLQTQQTPRTPQTPQTLQTPRTDEQEPAEPRTRETKPPSSPRRPSLKKRRSSSSAVSGKQKVSPDVHFERWARNVNWEDEYKSVTQLGKNSRSLGYLYKSVKSMENQLIEVKNRIHIQNGKLAMVSRIKDDRRTKRKNSPTMDWVCLYPDTVAGEMIELRNENKLYLKQLRQLQRERMLVKSQLQNVPVMQTANSQAAVVVGNAPRAIACQQMPGEESKQMEGAVETATEMNGQVVLQNGGSDLPVGVIDVRQLSVITSETICLDMGYTVPDLEDIAAYPQMSLVVKHDVARIFLHSLNIALRNIAVSLTGLEATRQIAQKCLAFCGGDPNNPFTQCISQVSQSVRDIMDGFAMKCRAIAVGLDNAATQFSSIHFLLKNSVDVRKLKVKMQSITTSMTGSDDEIEKLQARASENIKQALDFLFERVVGKAVCGEKQEDLRRARMEFQNALAIYTKAAKKHSKNSAALNAELTHWIEMRNEIQEQMDDLLDTIQKENRVLETVESLVKRHLRDVNSSVARENQKSTQNAAEIADIAYDREKMLREEEKDLKNCLKNLKKGAGAVDIGKQELKRLSKKKAQAERQIVDLKRKLEGLETAEVDIEIKRTEMQRCKERLEKKKADLNSILEEGQNITSSNMGPFLDIIAKLRKQTETLSLNMTTISSAFEQVQVSCDSEIFKQSWIRKVNWRKRGAMLREVTGLMAEVALLGQREIQEPLLMLQTNNCIHLIETADTSAPMTYVPSLFSDTVGGGGRITNIEVDEKELEELQKASVEIEETESSGIEVGTEIRFGEVLIECASVSEEFEMCSFLVMSGDDNNMTVMGTNADSRVFLSADQLLRSMTEPSEKK